MEEKREVERAVAESSNRYRERQRPDQLVVREELYCSLLGEMLYCRRSQIPSRCEGKMRPIASTATCLETL
jgi:hypothetical protein